MVRPLRLVALCLAMGLALGVAVPARAQLVKPWAPAGDTLLAMSAAAKVRFQRQLGDSVTGYNYEPYDMVAQASRHLLHSLGREHLLQAPALQATLDSLGLDVEVVNDRELPEIVFILIRNPYRPRSDTIGFYFWYRGSEMRMQGASFPPCRHVRIRSWWTGRPSEPYESALVYDQVGKAITRQFKLFRMDGSGNFWSLINYEGHGPELGPQAELTFGDVNHDGQPELIVFEPAPPDSFLTLISGTPPLVNELLYTEREEGFVLHDGRTVPSPVASLRLFVITLQHHDLESARRLLVHPEKLEEALANGWDKARGKGAWTVEYGENQAWPTWLELRIRTPTGHRRWVFHFAILDGRWVIRDWLAEQEPGPAPPHGTPGLSLPDSLRYQR